MPVSLSLPSRALAAGLAVALSSWMPAAVANAAYLILKGSGKRVEGSGLRRNAQGHYVIETGVGMQTFDAAQVERAEADPPPEWNQAMGMARTDPARAMQQFEQIAVRYRGLGWDDQAHGRLAQLAMRGEDYDTAIRAFQGMTTAMRESDGFRPAYWKALFEAGRVDRLETELTAAIRSGDRIPSARAHLLRGDIRMKRRQLQPAVMDYLRVVILYQAVQEVQAEALYKAGTALRELRDPRADQQFDELKRKYPSSEWARKG
jgi:tetratricopeptide (TPR) repeat protein